MNHGLKLHPDGTLEITMPKGKKVGRVLVCEAGTQNGSLYYPERDVLDTNDVIYRQDAIDTCKHAWAKGLEPSQYIEILPSAQPEQAVKDCRNCKHGKYNDYHDTYFCYNAEDCSNWDKWEPSAEPERKKGKWIHKHCVWFCSKCGENPTKGMRYVQGRDELYDFCPKCGSYNGGEKDDEQRSY